MADHRIPSRRSLLAETRLTRQYARTSQAEDERARLAAALKQQRDELVSKGVMASSLPVISQNMSARDLVAAQGRLNSAGPSNPRAGQIIRDPAGTPTNPGTGLVSRPTVESVQNQRNAISMARQSGTQDIADRKARGEITADQARQELRDLGSRTDAAATANTTTPTRPTGPTLANPTGAPTSGNAMKDAMVRLPFANGTRLPADAQVSTDGSGTSVMQQGSNGPRSVAIQPTMEQTMQARSGGKWAGMSTQERSQWLRDNARPAGGGGGVTTNSGTSGFNFRGEQNVDSVAAGGVGVQYDPTKDQGIIQAPTAPGATRSVYVDPKYQQGVSPDLAGIGSATTGGSMRPNRVFDETGDVTPMPASSVNVPTSVASSGQPETPLGSTSTSEDILKTFSENEYDDQFRKNLLWNGFSRGAA